MVGVDLCDGFTLAVTDAGAVFSFGHSEYGKLGHGSLEQNKVLPRQIQPLAQTGRRFVAVATGNRHALALTEEGELYGWGQMFANGHGSDAHTPRPVAALIGERVKLVAAGDDASCAVTEKGELFTWGEWSGQYNLGHGVGRLHATPKRVQALVWVKVAAVAIGGLHSLAADEDGVVWAFGNRNSLGLDHPNPGEPHFVKTPTPIPTLRVRALKSL